MKYLVVVLFLSLISFSGFSQSNCAAQEQAVQRVRRNYEEIKEVVSQYIPKLTNSEKRHGQARRDLSRTAGIRVSSLLEDLYEDVGKINAAYATLNQTYKEYERDLKTWKEHTTASTKAYQELKQAEAELARCRQQQQQQQNI